MIDDFKSSGAQIGRTKAMEATGPARTALDAILPWIAAFIEAAGVGIIVISAVAATALYLRDGAAGPGWSRAFPAYRANLGRGILLGLEFLVAADIIGTVALTPTLQSLAVLAGIVLIRTFLSFSLEVEIEGRWPWRRSDGKEGV